MSNDNYPPGQSGNYNQNNNNSNNGNTNSSTNNSGNNYDNNTSGNNSNNQNQGNNSDFDSNRNVDHQNSGNPGNNSNDNRQNQNNQNSNQNNPNQNSPNQNNPNQNNPNQNQYNNPNNNAGQNVNNPQSASNQNYSNSGNSGNYNDSNNQNYSDNSGNNRNEPNYGGPNDPNNPNFDNGNPNKNNNNRNILLAVLGTLLLAAAIYFIFLKNKDKKEVEKVEMANEDTVTTQKVLEEDSLAKFNRDQEGEYYEEEEYVTESYVVANEAYLRSSPSASPDTKVNSMKFGDKVYVKSGENTNGYSTVYLSKPANEKNITEQPYYLLESTVVSQYEYKQFKEFFSLAPFSTLASKTKKLILDKNYDNGVDYKVTQNSDRAKNALSYGDFDRDGITDVAIVLDNNEKQASRLLIICTNKATKDPYLAFAENYSDKVKINSFKKGSSIFMNTDEFMTSPNDGIIVRGEDVKIAMIYDNGLQKFKSYYQE